MEPASPAKRKFIALYALITVYGIVLSIALDPSVSAAFIMVSGGSSLQAGGVDAFFNLGIILSALLSAYILSKFRYYRRMFQLFHFFSFLSVAAFLASTFVLPPGAVVYFTLLLVFTYYFFTSCLSLPLYELVNLFVDRKTRVAVMSNSMAIGLLFAAGTSWGMRWILSRSFADPAFNYQLIYGGAAIAAGCCFLTMFALDKVEVDRASTHLSFGALYRTEWEALKRDGSLRLFFGASALFAVVWSSTGLFISIGFLRDAERMNDMLASGILIRTLLKAAGYYVCGRLAGRFGNKAVIVGIGTLALGSPITVLFLPFDFFIVVVIVTNLIQMSYVYLLNYLIDISDEKSFKGHFTLFTLCFGPATLLIPAFGWFIESMPALFCAIIIATQLLGIFAVLKFKASGVRHVEQRVGGSEVGQVHDSVRG